MSKTKVLPPLIQSVDDLRDHLQAAIELEHGTIPPYLCALYSIRPERNREAVEIIRTVVVQEMLHMVLVANVLNAVGGAPAIAYPDFVPEYPIALPLGQASPLQVSLRRFSRSALDTFLAIEQPAAAKPELKFFALKQAIPVPPGQLAAMVRAGKLYSSIGEFYKAIEHGLEVLEDIAAQKGETIFVGDGSRQVGPEHFYGAGGKATKVFDLASAGEALDVIVRQGEGYGGSISDSEIVGGEAEIAHYYRFQQLTLGRRYKPTDKAGAPTGESICVDYGPDAVFPMIENPRIDLFPLGEVQNRAIGFAVCYTKLLQLLQAGLNGNPTKLVESGVVMFDLRRMALDLLANPIDPDGFNAGPCFEFRTPT